MRREEGVGKREGGGETRGDRYTSPYSLFPLFTRFHLPEVDPAGLFAGVGGVNVFQFVEVEDIDRARFAADALGRDECIATIRGDDDAVGDLTGVRQARQLFALFNIPDTRLARTLVALMVALRFSEIANPAASSFALMMREPVDSFCCVCFRASELPCNLC